MTQYRWRKYNPRRGPVGHETNRHGGFWDYRLREIEEQRNGTSENHARELREKSPATHAPHMPRTYSERFTPKDDVMRIVEELRSDPRRQVYEGIVEGWGDKGDPWVKLGRTIVYVVGYNRKKTRPLRGERIRFFKYLEKGNYAFAVPAEYLDIRPVQKDWRNR